MFLKSIYNIIDFIILWYISMFPIQSISYLTPMGLYYYMCPYFQYPQIDQNYVKPQFQTLNQNSQEPPNSPTLSTSKLQTQQTMTANQDNFDINIPKCIQTKKIRKHEIKNEQESYSQFNPKKIKQETNKKKLKGKQNQNRNVTPNIIHQAFSFIGKRKKSDKLAQSLFKTLSTPQYAKIGRFYLYQKKIKEKMNHYLSQESLSLFNLLVEPQCEIYSKDQQEYYLKISRIMISYFLKTMCPSVTLTSKRMSKEKRIEHLRVRRYLMGKLDILFK